MGRVQDTWSQLEDPNYVHARNIVCSRNLLDILISVHGTEDDLKPPIDLTPPMVEKAAKKHAPPPAKPSKNIEPYWWHAMWFYNLVNFVPAATPGITIAFIIDTVSAYYGISKTDILSSRRTSKVMIPRQVCYYLAKRLTGKSLPEIGRRMGRDHTSALSGIRKIEKLRLADSELDADLRAISCKVGGMLA